MKTDAFDYLYLQLVGGTEPGSLEVPWTSWRKTKFKKTIRGIHVGANGRRFGMVKFHGDWRRVAESETRGIWHWESDFSGDRDGRCWTKRFYVGKSGARSLAARIE